MKQEKIKQIENIVNNQKVKIQGVEINLTEEQLSLFKEAIKPKRSNPYERVKEGGTYYYIGMLEGEFRVYETSEDNYGIDNAYFANINYYNNREFAEQVAMRMNLEQKLRKFTYENGWKDEFWGDEEVFKYYIYYDSEDKTMNIYCTSCLKRQDIHYISEEIAKRAINEIIEPFMEENPSFVW